ncbi:MAG: alpha/beta hydrolase [Rhodospirillales bacterium]|nr:alpha/beta hydrolase [Rhodospirillales bacterium]
MTFSIDRFIAPDGISLRLGIDAPDSPRGYVLVLQGRGEFIERYQETAADLASRGWGCVTFDFRGQGGSSREAPDPTMGFVQDLEDYAADTRHVINHVKQKHGITCDLVLTHSTGGLVAMSMILDQPDLWKSAVMIAPFFGLGGPEWLSAAAQFLSSGLCRYGFDKQYLPGQSSHSPLKGFEPDNLLTSDPARYERNRAFLSNDPSLLIGGTSAGWLDACFQAQASVAGKLKSIAGNLPPITMVLAGNDQVVSNQTTEEMFGKFPNITITEIPEARHEILQEQDLFRAQFWAAFDSHLAYHHP